MKRLLILAGEESGVLYAERIAARVRELWPEAEIRGYGDYGFEISDLAVFGIWAVLRKIGYFLKVKRTLERAIDEWRPDAVCTVDYPGMNLKLAAYAKRRGVRTVHVVCPQVWAWHRGRIPRIERSLDSLACFFPFEPKLFKPGFAEFVGHPLAQEIAPAVLPPAGRVNRRLAVLPGSRLSEIHYHLPVLLASVRELMAELPLRVVVPAANAHAAAAIAAALARQPPELRSVVELRRGGARAALADADAAVVASGTATLEAAMLNCPTVLVYKVGFWLGHLARWLIRGIRHVGLANIVAEKSQAECPTPELLQEDFTVANVVSALRPLLTDPRQNLKARQQLAATVRLLIPRGDPIANIVALLRPTT